MHIIFNMFGKIAAICTEVIFNRVCFNICVCIGADKFLPSSYAPVIWTTSTPVSFINVFAISH